MDLIGPTPLPRLELREGVPAELRTLVVVPTLLTGDAEIEEQIDRLEIHYLANPDGDVHFALLSDWTDAASETHAGGRSAPRGRPPTASPASTRATARAPGGGDRFLLLHRRRVWNASEGAWMGWERKRGKLDELNRLLPGRADTTFVGAQGPAPAVPAGVRYVITLDADTRLPRGAVDSPGRHDGPSAQPAGLRRPRGPRRRGLRRPAAARSRPTMPADRERSLFQRIFAGPGRDRSLRRRGLRRLPGSLRRGLVHRARASTTWTRSTAALEGRVPENALLSHDLFEGIFARAGLVTDIELFEEFPTDYEVAAGTPAPLGARRLAAPPLDHPGRRAARERGRPGSRSSAGGR